MQREIKFRAWTGSTMEYRVVAGALGAFYVPGLDPEDTACMSPFNTIYGEQTPVMQFTGLKDKNGKEIYEGDLVKYGSGAVRQISWVSVARKVGWSICPSRHWEVIGNIYEDRDLLK